MAILFTLYTDFPSFQKAEEWLDLQINLLYPHANLVRWPSTDLLTPSMVYTEAGIHTIHWRSPPDASTNDIARNVLDARYNVFAGAQKGGSKKVFVTKNGWLSYTSWAKPDGLREVSILFSSEPEGGVERGDNPWAMVDKCDKNPYQVDNTTRMFWDPALVINVASIGGDIEKTQDILRTTLFSLLVKYECANSIPALLLSPLLQPPVLKSFVVICGLAASGKSSVFSYLKTALSEPRGHAYFTHSTDLITACLNKMKQEPYTVTSPGEKVAIMMTGFESFSKDSGPRKPQNVAVLDFGECPATLKLLKQLLGSRLRIIYIETDGAIRIQRAGRRRFPSGDPEEQKLPQFGFNLMLSGQDPRDKDEPPMRQLANFVLNNNGPLAGTLSALQDHLTRYPLGSVN